jgi:hypothetical protein
MGRTSWRKFGYSYDNRTIGELRYSRRVVRFQVESTLGGWLLYFHIHVGGHHEGYVLAEKSREVRVFKTCDAALKVIGSFGQSKVSVPIETNAWDATQRAERAPTEEGAAPHAVLRPVTESRAATRVRQGEAL